MRARFDEIESQPQPTRLMFRSAFSLALVASLSACAHQAVPFDPTGRGAHAESADAPEQELVIGEEADVGVLVMAHGGTSEWNVEVGRSIESLRRAVPTALALGMADPHTMQAALDSLQSQGVQRVAVVRLFLSGDSFLHQTEYLLGLRTDAPRWFMHHGGGDGGTPEPLRHGFTLSLQRDGLADASEAALILRERIEEASGDPSTEAVLILAHGAGDDREDQRIQDRMRAAIEGMSGTFAEIQVATLREDWADKRVAAEANVRAFVAGQVQHGHRAIVVPFRLFGHGPYGTVLEGLEHDLTDGLLPHAMIGRWVERTASEQMCRSGWMNPLADCRDGRPVVTEGR